MKNTDLEKHLGKKITGRMKREPTPDRYGAASGMPADRREQRERDKAAGRVPFAVKLPQELVTTLQALAQQRQLPLDELAAELLSDALRGKERGKPT